MSYTQRLQKIQEGLGQHKVQAVLVTYGPNIYYLTGFTGSSAQLLITKTEAYFLTDFRYQAQARAQVPADYQLSILTKDLAKEIKQIGIQTLGIESEHLTVATFHAWEKKCMPTKLVPLLRIVEQVRLVKDSEEVESLKKAVNLTDRVFEEICSWLKAGFTEEEVAQEIENRMKKGGALKMSFPPIVASGTNGALPHAQPGSKRLEIGDLITLDMGAVVDGYCADLTRTVCLGKPTNKQKEIYHVVWQAQTRSAAAVRPGRKAKEIDQIGRQIIEKAGYGKYFGHALGHGVGLEIHEAPTVSAFSKEVLVSGAVITCEPGIYVDGWGGVRVEDMVLVTEQGCEVLSHASKPDQLICL